MSYSYLIDSSLWVAYFSGSKAGEKLQMVLEEEEIATSILAIAELADKYGREGKSFSDRLTFITSKAAILPLTISISLLASKIKGEERKTKPKFGLIDALHLATAREQNAILLTTDNDLRWIKDVEVLEA